MYVLPRVQKVEALTFALHLLGSVLLQFSLIRSKFNLRDLLLQLEVSVEDVQPGNREILWQEKNFTDFKVELNTQLRMNNVYLIAMGRELLPALPPQNASARVLAKILEKRD